VEITPLWDEAGSEKMCFSHIVALLPVHLTSIYNAQIRMFYESEGPWAYYGGFFHVFTNKNFRGPGHLWDSSPTLRLLPYGHVGNIPILTIIPVVTTWGYRPASQPLSQRFPPASPSSHSPPGRARIEYQNVMINIL